MTEVMNISEGEGGGDWRTFLNIKIDLKAMVLFVVENLPKFCKDLQNLILFLQYLIVNSFPIFHKYIKEELN